MAKDLARIKTRPGMPARLDRTFCDAVLRAIGELEREQADRDTCPKELGGCGRAGALCSITKHGLLGRFCPVCRLFVARKRTGRARIVVKGKKLKGRVG